jgi:long-chain acyl-CoA synthetase
VIEITDNKGLVNEHLMRITSPSGIRAMTNDRPWLRFYGRVPCSIDYPEITLYEAIASTAGRVPDAIAWDFLDTTSSYRNFLAEIDRFANVLAALGLGRGQRFLISMPTSPQGIIAFYAANKLGAVPAMIHPLSTGPEIEQFLQASGARMALTLDAFYPTFAAVAPSLPIEHLILARIPDYLSARKRLGFWLTKGRKIRKVPSDRRVHWWANLMSSRHEAVQRVPTSTNDPAAILFSGGTTGTPKAIMLSNRNFIAESLQLAAWAEMKESDSILAILPIFHGFGLGACVNAFLMAGAKSILVPVFNAKSLANLIRKKRPTVLAGPPTLFDALIKDRSFRKSDLSCLRGTVCGADTLPGPLRDRFNSLLRDRGSNAQLVEGYGLTESVTGIMGSPMNENREGSIGIPFPDMLAKICKPGTTEEVAPHEEGEICISGPAVMLGYLDDPAATAETLKAHADGRTWLHTGDLGTMDEDGFFHFRMRLKRMIKCSGFNVYPTQVEAVLYQHPLVAQACVVGIPDPVTGERVKAYIVLKDAWDE